MAVEPFGHRTQVSSLAAAGLDLVQPREDGVLRLGQLALRLPEPDQPLPRRAVPRVPWHDAEQPLDAGRQVRLPQLLDAGLQRQVELRQAPPVAPFAQDRADGFLWFRNMCVHGADIIPVPFRIPLPRA